MDFYNKHYIRVDENGNITYGFSDAFEQPKPNDICINEQGGRHFSLDNKDNPNLITTDNIYLYVYKNGQVYKKSDDQIQKEIRHPNKIRQSKLDEVNRDCENTIYNGVDVNTSQGIKHFSLFAEDQMNLTSMLSQLKDALAGNPSSINPQNGVPYHADGELCRFWSAEDFIKIATTAIGFAFYNQTYCNHLRQYIKRINVYDELENVKYGMALPDDLQQSMNQLLQGWDLN